MNIIDKYRFFAVATAVALLLSGCTKESIDEQGKPLPVGDEVAVSLTLMPQGLVSPVSPSSAMTKAVTATGSMNIELVDEPTTRAMDDAAVENVWVLQFNGAGDGALLVGKQYREKMTADKTFALKKGTDQRVVVLANSFDKALGDQLTASSTYATLKTLVRPVEQAIEGGVPMSGNEVTNITTNVQVTIPLTRVYAKVTVRVKLGAGMVTTGWQAQAMEVAPAYWFPEATGVFPSEDKLTEAFYTPQSDLTLSTSNYTDFTFYLPVNRRGEVAGTSTFDRRTNAPRGATYIKLSRSSTESNILKRANYYIHPGANLTTDYNLRENTQYTIKATLLSETGDDSRAENKELDVSDLQYAGMFGGELKARNGVWQFTKELWVQKSDASASIKWDTEAPGVTTNINDIIDGKGNTLKLVKLGDRYAAAKLCFDKNTGLNAATATTSDPAYLWYLPAQNQLMGVWVAHSSFATALQATYWGSTETISSYSWYVNFSLGYTNSSNKTYTHDVRCVREL